LMNDSRWKITNTKIRCCGDVGERHRKFLNLLLRVSLVREGRRLLIGWLNSSPECEKSVSTRSGERRDKGWGRREWEGKWEQEKEWVAFYLRRERWEKEEGDQLVNWTVLQDEGK
jgi:hypothetical protein